MNTARTDRPSWNLDGEAFHTLSSAAEVPSLLRALVAAGFDGEVELEGARTGRAHLYDGAIAWIRSDDHHEHLGDVLRRELGISARVLYEVMARCRVTGQRLGEALVEPGLVRPAELRDCLQRHMSAQLQRILAWSGPVSATLRPRAHRYDARFLLSVEALLRIELPPTDEARARARCVVARCRSHEASIDVACIVETATGALVWDGFANPDFPETPSPHAGLYRLVTNRALGLRDIATGDLFVTAGARAFVAHPLRWKTDWLLVVGGHVPIGRLLAAARIADLDIA